MVGFQGCGGWSRYARPCTHRCCVHAWALRLGSCKLDPLAAISLPSLETLLLTRVADAGRDVQRLISGCPRLADLTLEACAKVTTLSVLDKRLRRLALRCCYSLASVAIDASELLAFEYRGAVPAQPPFLTMHGLRSISWCKVDLCGEELSSEEELVTLRELLTLFVDAKHLHLQTARLGSGLDNGIFARLPAFSFFSHLELTGCLPQDDDAIVGAATRILEHAPNLEVLSLFFRPPQPRQLGKNEYCYKEEALLDAHHLKHDRNATLDAPSVLIPCLRSRVREINLVHYHGCNAQRMLAKFLLRNAQVIDELYCQFTEGPLYIQTELGVGVDRAAP